MAENKNALKFKVVTILEKHILKDLTVNQFKELTDALDLDDITIKVRDEMIKINLQKIRSIEANNEFDLLELLDGDE